jgi:hypothetical protein
MQPRCRVCTADNPKVISRAKTKVMRSENSQTFRILTGPNAHHACPYILYKYVTTSVLCVDPILRALPHSSAEGLHRDRACLDWIPLESRIS